MTTTLQGKANYCYGCGFRPWNDGERCGCKGGPRCGYCFNGKPELCDGGVCRNAENQAPARRRRESQRQWETVCLACGVKFRNSRSTSRYCGGTCRQRANRANSKAAVAIALQAPAPAPEKPTAVVIALQALDQPEDKNRCSSCGQTGIVRDAAGQQVAGGAHVATKTALTGLCWFCWKKTAEGVDSMAHLQEVIAKTSTT